MTHKLDNLDWLFLYSQITGGEIGKQLLFDSSGGIITTPTYGSGLFRATNTDTQQLDNSSSNKSTDNFYDVTVEIVANYLTAEITPQCNWYAEASSGSRTLLGYMTNPTQTGLNTIMINITESTTKYHTLLFNINTSSFTANIDVYYRVGSTIVGTTAASASELGSYIHPLNSILTYDNILIQFSSDSTIPNRINIVGLIKTDNLVTAGNLVCFGENSMVLTPSGEVAIQTLKQGDEIYDEHLNIQTVEFVAKRTIFPSKSFNKYSVPYEIKQGQLSENVPNRDTLVSAAHLLKHNGQMVPASTLGTVLEINTIFTYYNVKVNNYSTMIVNGLVSETLDNSDDSKVYEKIY